MCCLLAVGNQTSRTLWFTDEANAPSPASVKTCRKIFALTDGPQTKFVNPGTVSVLLKALTAVSRRSFLSGMKSAPVATD